MVHGVRRRGNRTKIFALRLTPAEHAEIQRLAEHAGIPASGIVRRWLEAGMAAERDDSIRQTVESLTRDVEWLRRQLAA